jgi:hypothetical protein
MRVSFLPSRPTVVVPAPWMTSEGRVIEEAAPGSTGPSGPRLREGDDEGADAEELRGCAREDGGGGW